MNGALKTLDGRDLRFDPPRLIMHTFILLGGSLDKSVHCVTYDM